MAEGFAGFDPVVRGPVVTNHSRVRGTQRMDERDIRLLKAISDLGTGSPERLHEETDIPVSTIHYRLNNLREAGVITNDLSKANRAARDIEAGNIWVNQYNDFPAGQPFGGYKQSGIGREQAEATLDHYSQTKTINMNL